MIFEALPARFGDCLLLLTPDGAGQTKLMVIDGGPGTVFKDSLKPRLAQLAAGPGTQTIDAVMVSHIDADHITGIISLLQAIQTAKVGNKQPPYKVGQLIFNSFDKIADSNDGELSGPGGVLASLSGSSLLLGDHIAQEVLASVAQGSTLSGLAKTLKVPLNPQASPKGSVLTVTASPPKFAFGEASFTVVGPRQKEVDALRKAWDAWRKTKGKDEFKALAAYADESVPNLSSIVVWVDWKGKTLLLTGDARGDYTLAGLRQAGLLAGNSLAKPLDILKLPHHGSDRNVDGDFFKALPARHYVASGDGWYGNPDRSTLEMIEAARPNGDYTLHLTYSPEHLDQQHAAYLAQQSPAKSFIPAKHAVTPVVSRLEKAGVTVRTGKVRIDLAKGD